MKKKALLILSNLVIFLLISAQLLAQEQRHSEKDSVIELYGVIMTADSLQGIPAASIIVEGKGRGTISNDRGIFSIAVLKGDHILFSCIGFKNKEVKIPQHLKGDQYSMIQLMVTDTNYLPATVLKPRPTKEQFERDFANASFPDDMYEVARQNTSEEVRRALMNVLPADSKEAVNYQIRKQANRYMYSGQLPPQNIFNPMAWAEFIQAWKRGDFKSKSSD